MFSPLIEERKKTITPSAYTYCAQWSTECICVAKVQHCVAEYWYTIFIAQTGRKKKFYKVRCVKSFREDLTTTRSASVFHEDMPVLKKLFSRSATKRSSFQSPSLINLSNCQKGRQDTLNHNVRYFRGYRIYRRL